MDVLERDEPVYRMFTDIFSRFIIRNAFSEPNQPKKLEEDLSNTSHELPPLQNEALKYHAHHFSADVDVVDDHAASSEASAVSEAVATASSAQTSNSKKVQFEAEPLPQLEDGEANVNLRDLYFFRLALFLLLSHIYLTHSAQ